MNLLSLARQFLAKDLTAQDVHESNAGGSGGKKKKKPSEKIPTVGSTEKFAQVLKVDDSHGLVLGWAIVCKRDGKDYVDLQNDIIPEDVMLSAAVDFMASPRVAKEMHEGEPKGSILFAFPMTEDIAKAFGIETKTSGLMVAMKPDSPEMLAKFKDGTYTGFSIGGSIQETF